MSDGDLEPLFPAQSYNGLFNVPGQGLVAQITVNDIRHLYDAQGIQYRIMQLRKASLSSEIEERALQQLSIFEEIR